MGDCEEEREGLPSPAVLFVVLDDFTKLDEKGADPDALPPTPAF